MTEARGAVPVRSRARRLPANFLVGAGIVGVLVLLAALAPLVAPYNRTP